MLNIVESTSNNLPPQVHAGHRILDVTAIGNIHPRWLCLDCHLEFEERKPDRNTDWINRL